MVNRLKNTIFHHPLFLILSPARIDVAAVG